MKQWEMQNEYQNNSRIRFFLGDVRDKSRLSRALDNIDYVIHAAALKIVTSAEYNPFECINTNINGAINLIDAAIDRGVKRVIALSTDKASSPINLYGATKLVSDKLFIAGNSYTGNSNTKFSVVRYGNVLGSRGSFIPYLVNNSNMPYVPITDTRMTRFILSIKDGVELVWKSLEDCMGGEIYVKKTPSIKIVDMAKYLLPEKPHKIIGIKPGEKIHEEMISIHEGAQTYEYDEYYKILPSINSWNMDKTRIKNGFKVDDNFSYTSENNKFWLSKNEFKNLLKNDKFF